MFGIYKYENGLRFTGKIAKTEEEAKDYIAQICGRVQPVFTGNRENDGTPIYENKFVPNYNTEAFVIQPVELIGTEKKREVNKMKRFTDKMVKTNMYGKGLHACIKYLNAIGITRYSVDRNSKGHPIALRFMLGGTGFAGYCKAVTFNKNSGLCDSIYC